MRVGIFSSHALSCFLFLGLSANYALAAKFFVWGGGPVKEFSQVVLEKNLNLFHELANAKAVPLSDRKTYFGAGLENTEDVVFQSRKLDVDERVLSSFYRPAQTLNMSFRHNEVQNLTGNASKENILNESSSFLSSLQSNDKSRFFFTGHGHNQPNHFQNNFFVSYKGDEVNVAEFTKVLDQSNAQASLQLVMTQCFSGGFSQIVYDEGKFKGTLSKKNRCGFFSQIPSRVASGCSADILMREEYSPYFFAALKGVDENGRPVQADYNGDHVVTSNEAHYYVVASENSFDIPVTTSTEFLKNELSSSALEELSDAEFLAMLKAEEKAAFVKLAEITGLNVRAPNESIQSALTDKLKAKKQSISEHQVELKAKYNAYNLVIRPVLFQVNRMNEDPGPEALKEFVMSYPRYESVKTAFLEYEKASEKSHQLTVEMAKLERLEYLMNTKKLEKLLLSSGTQEEIEKYAQLKACENESFF